MTARLPRPLSMHVLTFVLLLLCVKMTRDTAYNGWDFEVYWRAAKAALQGERVYSVARDGAMVFKYPPWILPIFIPFALISLTTAKWIWGIVQSLALVSVIRDLRRSGIQDPPLALLLALFFGIWAVHSLTGQITLPLLALGLRFSNSGRFTRRDRVTLAAAVWAWSSKIFTLFPVLFLPDLLRSTDLRRKITWALTFFALLCFLSLPALSGIDASGLSGLQELFYDWWTAIQSGGTAVRGLRIGTQSREMQGLGSLILRLFSVPESDTQTTLAINLGVAVTTALVWLGASRSLTARDRYWGALALTPCIQPLAWFHFYSLTFPIAAVTLNALMQRPKAFSIQTKLLFFCSLLATTAITEKTLGALGAVLELVSIKSIGALGLVYVFTRFCANSKTHRPIKT